MAREIVEADHADALATSRAPIVRFVVPAANNWPAVRNHPAEGRLGEFVTLAMRDTAG